MPPPPIVDDGEFDLCLALPPPLPLLTSCRDSRSAPLYQHSFHAPTNSAFCDLPEPAPTNEADDCQADVLLTSPAATFKDQGREISGLNRAFFRPSATITAGVQQARQQHKRRAVRGDKCLPRHPPLVPSKSSPALHRSPSRSPPLPVHVEESSDPSQQHENKHYSPSDCTTLLSPSSIQSTSQSGCGSSPSMSPLYLCSSSSSTVLTPASVRCRSATSLPSKSVSISALSAHINPFHTQASQRSFQASHSVRSRGRRVAEKRQDKDEEDADGRVASTASTCSMASSSLSAQPSPHLARRRSSCFNDDSDNEADVDSSSDGSDDEHEYRARRTPSHSPPTHFTFPASLSRQVSANFSPSSSSSNLCFSPHSPLFDTSLSGGRHSADPQLSAGIGVFAGQLQALRRMRSASSLSSPAHSSVAAGQTSQ